MNKKNDKINEKKQETLMRLRTAEAVYVIMSQCTHMPYVMCDPETYDDEIFVFFGEDEAMGWVRELLAEQNPVVLGRFENSRLLGFFTGLYTIGVNCIAVNQGQEDEMKIQLSDLIVRKPADQLPEGQERVENPEMHLTALYFVQEFRKKQNPEIPEELRELNEEMLAHFERGRYIVAVQDGEGIPVLKQKDGRIYQPLFTDIYEFRKFDKEKKYKAAVVEASDVTKILSKEAVGVAVNPFGVNVLLNIQRKA